MNKKQYSGMTHAQVLEARRRERAEAQDRLTTVLTQAGLSADELDGFGLEQTPVTNLDTFANSKGRKWTYFTPRDERRFLSVRRIALGIGSDEVAVSICCADSAVDGTTPDDYLFWVTPEQFRALIVALDAEAVFFNGRRYLALVEPDFGLIRADERN